MLTAEQQQALNTEKHIFVEAGAGSGKTTILVKRYLSILKENRAASPEHIIALTFTEKAAGEMLHRIQSSCLELPENTTEEKRFKYNILDSIHLVSITTIHSYCMSLIKRYPLEADIDPAFTILSEDDLHYTVLATLKTFIKEKEAQQAEELGLLLHRFTKKQIIQLIQEILRYKTTILHDSYATQIRKIKALYAKREDNIEYDLEEDLERYSIALLSLAQQSWDKVEKIKQNRAQYDFQDILIKTRDMLKNNPELCHNISKNISHFMVDEFQDTDPIQWEIISLIKEKQDQLNLFLVGDLKQSIYSFRGAESRQFQDIQTTFFDSLDNAAVISLKDNFRSNPLLIEFVNALFRPLFENCDEPIPYTSMDAHKASISPAVTLSILKKDPAITLHSELDNILRWIQDKKEKGVDLSEIAILCRRKKSIPKIAEYLEKNEINVAVHNADEDMENDLCILLYQVLKGLYDLSNNLAWITVLKSPLFKISDDTLFLLYQQQDNHCLTDLILHKDFSNIIDKINIPTIEKDSLKQATTRIKKWKNIFSVKTLSETLKDILIDCQLIELMRLTPKYEDYVDTLTFFVDKIIEIESTPFISKGLEFPYVIIPECGKRFNYAIQRPVLINTDKTVHLNIFPSAIKNPYKESVTEKIKNQVTNEEKRIFYVACTRAEKELFLSGTHHFKAIKDKNSYTDFLFSIGEFSEENNTLHIPGYEQSINITPQYNKENTRTPEEKETQLVENTKTELTIIKPLTITPSENKKEKKTLELWWESKDKKNATHSGKAYGRILHRLIEQLNIELLNNPDANTINQLKSLLLDSNSYHEYLNKYISYNSQISLYSSQKKALQSACITYLNSTLIETILSASKANQIYHEYTLQYRDKNQLKKIRIDTLIKSSDSTYAIIDYKTDASIQSEIDIPIDYKKQLHEYKAICASILKIDPHKISTYLYICKNGRLVHG